MTSVVCCEVEESWQGAYLKERLQEEASDVSVSVHEAPLQTLPVSSVEEAEVLSVFIESDCSADQLDSMPELELITTRSTGFDHVDLDACASRDITVCNVPTYGEHTVAEHTFALLLNLSRRVHEVVQKTNRKEFQFGGQRGFDLRGKTLGIIGTGHIGKHVAKMARGFGMDVVAFDVEEDSFTAELLGFEYVSFDELLNTSDIISLHVPLNEQTNHLLDADELDQCQDHTIIINTARGGLINTSALREKLEANELGGAGLDVIEGEEVILSESKLNEKNFSRDKLEQLVENSKLLKRDDVIFTPHMAYNSREAIERILDTTVKNITSFLNDTPVHTVHETG